MARRADLLEFAILGLLHEGPTHGYDLRRRLNSALGPFRALSYGSLYPALRTLTDRGLIAHVDEPGMNPLSTGARAAASARPRISYQLTAEGKEHFETLARRAGTRRSAAAGRAPAAPAPTPPRTTPSRCASPSSRGPRPTSAGSSSKDGATACRNDWTPVAPTATAAANRPTRGAPPWRNTPRRAPSARCAGSPNSSTPRSVTPKTPVPSPSRTDDGTGPRGIRTVEQPPCTTTKEYSR